MKQNNENILRSGLYIVSTPIGNLKDITFRAIETLQQSDLIACEDTRVSKILLEKYGIKTPTISIHNYNEADKIDYIKKQLSLNKVVSLISDAGTPLISDPGYKLSSELRKSGFYVTVVPGPTSPIAGLTLSGFPTNRFLFIGFVPTKVNERESFFKDVVNEKGTIIFFETANRLLDTLSVIKKVFGEREIAIIREISKIYEDVQRGQISDIISHFEQTPAKGEIVGLIKGHEDTETINETEIKNMLEFLLSKMSLKDASEFIGNTFSISKKIVYNIGIKLKQEG